MAREGGSPTKPLLPLLGVFCLLPSTFILLPFLLTIPPPPTNHPPTRMHHPHLNPRAAGRFGGPVERRAVDVRLEPLDAAVDCGVVGAAAVLVRERIGVGVGGVEGDRVH